MPELKPAWCSLTAGSICGDHLDRAGRSAADNSGIYRMWVPASSATDYDYPAHHLEVSLPAFLGKCSDLGIPALDGANIAPKRVYHRRGCLIGESPGKDCKAEALDGGCGGVPHNKCPPPPGQRLSHKSKGQR